MDAAVIVTRLRSAGYLPAIVDGRIRLYGDTDSLPLALRDVLTANRNAVIAYLRRPEQSIANDLIANAADAGWFPSVCGTELEWQRGEERTPNPFRTEALHTALEQHHNEVIAVLRPMPPAYHEHQRSTLAGIRPEDIEESARATEPSSPPVVPPDTSQVAAAKPPGGDAYHRIWTCTSCHLPRSCDDRPCPGCGATEGYIALRPANRFTGLT